MGKKLKIEVTIGYKEVAHNGVETYFGDYTDNGQCYKNLQAFENGLGVIYISEGELEDGNCNSLNSTLWTRTSWIEYVREQCLQSFGKEIYENVEKSDFMPFIEHCALSILQDCDWQDLSTLLEEHLQYGEYFENMLESYLNEKHY
jgi:hypothetical protein